MGWAIMLNFNVNINIVSRQGAISTSSQSILTLGKRDIVRMQIPPNSSQVSARSGGL